MTALVLLIGIALPALFGWLILRCAEASSPVLSPAERIVWSLVLGPTAHALLIFCCSVGIGVPLTRMGMLVPLLLGIAILGLWVWRRGWHHHAIPRLPSAASCRRCLSLPLALLMAWTVLKLLAGSYDLVIAPTYWDDSFNNWNMRAKVFVREERIVLELPGGNDVTIGARGVNSYPPSLPLIKTWLTVLRGRWEEPLSNGVHMLWLLGILGSLGCALHHRRGPRIALLGIYAAASLPLLLIHGANPYADAMLGSHLLLAVLAALGTMRGTSLLHERSWAKLLGIAVGLLLFTKNEATVLYVPLLAVIWSITLIRRGGLGTALPVIGRATGIALALILPWLSFKWMHGLTFGNAKAVSGVSYVFNAEAALSIWFQLSHEPNFLLLPVVIVLTVLLRWRSLRTGETALLASLLFLALAVQWSLFSFVQELATEAIRQTGTSRGMVHLAPIAVLLVLLAWTKSEEQESH